MKRYGNLWNKICDIENLRYAHKKAREDKAFYKEVKMVNSNEDYYLNQIRDMLVNKTYKVTPEDYDVSIIKDRSKERELRKLTYYPHRIIQWAVMLQLEPIFMKTFCDHTCASIKFKGGNHVRKLIKGYLQDKSVTYCLKIDIRKFYPNINHETLKKLLRKKFKDKDLLELLDMIVDSHPGGIGLPIGSYLSQFMANYYLCYFDHYMKEVAKAKMIIRYMDDIVVLGRSKEELRDMLQYMREYLEKDLQLSIKDNWAIFPIRKRGIDFVGYRYFGEYTLLRKSTCRQFKGKAVRILEKHNQKKLVNYSEWCSMNSYTGWLTWCDSWRLFDKYLTPVIPALIKYYQIVIQRDKPEKVLRCRVRKYKRHLSKLHPPMALKAA